MTRHLPLNRLLDAGWKVTRPGPASPRLVDWAAGQLAAFAPVHQWLVRHTT